MSLTISDIVQAKVDYYELEGWLYYGIAFYKSKHKKLQLPFFKKMYLRSENNSNNDYINLNIDVVGDQSTEVIRIIEIKVVKYLGGRDEGNLTCQLIHFVIDFEDQIKIKKIY